MGHLHAPVYPMGLAASIRQAKSGMMVEEEKVSHLLGGLEVHDSIMCATCTVHADFKSSSHDSIGKAFEIQM